MGFFDVLKRMAEGKPAFEVPQNAGQKQEHGQAAGQPNQRSNTPKERLNVTIVRSECESHGSSMTCSFYMRNDSSIAVTVDDISVLGMNYKLGNYLTPGEEEETPQFQFTRPTNTSNSDCTLRYHGQENNDYFESEHTLEFRKEADNTYTVSDIRTNYVKDT